MTAEMPTGCDWVSIIIGAVSFIAFVGGCAVYLDILSSLSSSKEPNPNDWRPWRRGPSGPGNFGY